MTQQQNNEQQPPSHSSEKVNPLVSGLQRDPNDTYIPEGSWSYARNASKVTPQGDLQTISNEQANFLCQTAPYTVTGAIHLFAGNWAIFSTDNTNSEIGYFQDDQCLYTQLVRDPCTGVNSANPNPVLNFSQLYLINGASKQNFDCTWSVYFTDGFNVDRYIRIDVSGAIPIITNTGFNSQFINKCSDSVNTWFSNNPPPSISGCETCIPTCSIDPNLIRLASLVESPCITCSKSRTPGSLLNGSYFATIRYTINEQPYGDFFPPSNSQPLFSHQDESGALQISFSGLDTINFTEFELVIVRNVNLQTTAKRIGIYSTFSQEILIASINEALPDIPIEQIPIRTPVFEKSEAIYPVGNYLIRVAPTSKFDFNYQPLANRITCDWISVQYPASYYRDGGSNPSLLRDEIYPFFIRWVWDTGDRTSSYHIPGRVFDPTIDGLPIPILDVITPGETYWEVVNTAYPNPVFTPYNLADGGLVIAQGKMGYWESTETYPPNEPDVWDLSFWQTTWLSNQSLNNIPTGDYTTPAYNLCGLPIRHHKIPDNFTNGSVQYPDACNHIDLGGNNIRLIGVKFGQIIPPVDNNGVPILGIVGYEILRGSREGNKTIIAKGMVNNTRPYTTSSGRQGLYQNYPYNYTGIDPSLYSTENVPGSFSDPLASFPIAPNSLGYDHLVLNGAPVGDSIVTFHSPDTQFKHPFLAINEIKKYGNLLGDITGYFEDVPGHPKEKLLTDLAFYVAAIIGIGEAMLAMRGKRTIKQSDILSGTSTTAGYYDITMPWAVTGAAIGSSLPPGVAGVTLGPIAEGIQTGAFGSYLAVKTGLDASIGTDGYGLINYLDIMLLSRDPYDIGLEAQSDISFAIQGGGVYRSVDTDVSSWYANPFSAVFGVGALMMSHYWILGAETVTNLIYAIIPFEKYAYRYISHGFYGTNDQNIPIGSRRYLVDSANYLENSRQFFNNYEVNNLYRGNAAILYTHKPVSLAPFGHPTPFNPNYQDFPIPGPNTSLQTIGSANTFGLGPTTNDPKAEFNTNSSSFYAALIQRISNQYGQTDSIQQIPVCCPQIINTSLQQQSSNEVFAGDTYVCRYTEKNTFFYFYDWLYNQPDGFEFDYTTRYMITYPRFWADFTKYDPAEIFGLFTFTGVTPGGGLPDRKAYLDKLPDPTSSWLNILSLVILRPLSFIVTDSYFYLFQSGVRDFFVESEINTEQRDWGDLPEERHYDNYTYSSLPILFDTKIIKSANYYKYDFSLSLSRQFQTFTSWGNIQPRDYDPFIAASCYVTRPNRIIYSLPQHLEDERDYWRVFLINNYRDFYSPVSAVKPINKSGAIFLFKYDSPIEFQGVDSQPLDAKLLTPNGWKTMGEITTSDQVIGRDGRPHNILNVYEIGDKPIYKIIFKDGAVVRASDTHQWNVLDDYARAKKRLTYMKEQTKSTLQLKYQVHHRDAILPPAPINFPHKKYVISPYTMGVLLADGCITRITPLISMNETEILDRVVLETNTKSKITKRIDKRFGNTMFSVMLTAGGARRKDSNPFHKELKRYGLSGCNSYTKFIPDEYFFGSVTQRLDLLKGLMDCDGTISITKSKIAYSTVSIRLVADIIKLVESLGGCASVSGYKKNNFTGNPIVEYRVRLQMDINPFFLSRKAIRFKHRKKMVLRTIKDVEFDGIEKARCIKTDAPDELYITDNYILTHNTLQTDLGTKVTLGDGGLFSQAEQSVANVDISYEYGSCQDRLSIINTPFGLYYICANQGKIFKKGGDMSRIYRGQGALDDITYAGLKFWFKEYLPFWLLKDFPNFSVIDNPVAGIGCQSIYDNQIETIYFCKKDYKLKPQPPLGPAPVYNGGISFTIQGITFDIGAPDNIWQQFFDDASWTVSYDPKAEKGGWISYHDWHPDLNIASKNNFLTTQGTQIWRQNDRRDLYCNYYGIQYPYEVEYIASTQLSVNTLRSIEYYLECYKYNPGTLDRYHILDEGFDHAVIYNTEQVSGLLTLIDKPKNNPFGELAYPQIIGNSTGILYDKVEQRYRFNSFWDLTRDRGEYPQYPLTGAQAMIWITDPNGYTRTLNALNIDLNKPQFQRKRFRHYLTKTWLQKLNPNSTNYVTKASVEKNLTSLR